MGVKRRMKDPGSHPTPPSFSLSPPLPVQHQGTMQEELYTVLRVADLSRLAAAEFKPEGAPIVSGELKTIQYNTIYELKV